MRTRIIGVDCATKDAKVGLALGWYEDGSLTIAQASVCSEGDPAAIQICNWLTEGRQFRTVLAIDAPLGWPVQLSQALVSHLAGQEIPTDPNELFRRETDRFIKTSLGKTPLDIGADRIARTAHAALRLLGELRRALKEEIPLAWHPTFAASPAVIEVYPAATLISNGFQTRGYRGPDRQSERDAIVERLGTLAVLPDITTTVKANADALDAAICLLAAADFLQGAAMPPPADVPKEQEGWIWVRALDKRADA